MLQYTSHLQLCSNEWQNKLFWRQQEYIGTYKTVQKLYDTLKKNLFVFKLVLAL